MQKRDLVTDEELNEMLETRNCCPICETHSRVYKKFKHAEEYELGVCPDCGGEIKRGTWASGDLIACGETNGCYDNDEKMYYILCGECQNCGKTFGLFPEEIIYNGNHDIFYTGGKSYIPPYEDAITAITKKCMEKIKENTKQFVDRVKEGENLSDWQ
jgi:hypothetical protein